MGAAADAAKTGGGKRERIGWLAPASVVAFVALTLAGTYFVRKAILERTMSRALANDDAGMIADLAFSWPCPVNAQDNDARTALHWAAGAGRVDIVKRLLSKGADANAKDRWEVPPLHWAAMYGHKETAELLLARGAHVNAKTVGGGTPLHVATYYGHKEIVELLLSKGADIDVKDNSGVTALWIAVQYGRDAVAEVLRKAGAKE